MTTKCKYFTPSKFCIDNGQVMYIVRAKYFHRNIQDINFAQYYPETVPGMKIYVIGMLVIWLSSDYW